MKSRSWRLSRSAYGFTLVELLVVIAIIGVLVALLLPAAQAAREAARRAQCQSNIKQIGLAVVGYTEAHAGELPPGGITNGDCCGTKSKESWSIVILPHLEQQNLYDQYDFEAFNEDEVNWPVLQTILPVYLCPSDEDTDTLERPQSGPGNNIPMARGSYRANSGRCGNPAKGNWDSASGSDGFFPKGRNPDFSHWKGPFRGIGKGKGRKIYLTGSAPSELQHITDGLSNTIFIGEGTSKSSTGSASAAEANRRRRTFWAYSYTSYNRSCVFPETRTMLFDYARCVDVGGPGGKSACKRAWGALHPGGLHFAFGDGSVHFLSADIDMELFAGMASIAGGELPRPL